MIYHIASYIIGSLELYFIRCINSATLCLVFTFQPIKYVIFQYENNCRLTSV